MTPEEQTRFAWEAFSLFSNSDLSNLLIMAGIAAMKDRDMMLHQALIVWFHGSIPNTAVIPELAEAEMEKIYPCA